MRKAPAILALLAVILAAVGSASVNDAAADPTVAEKRAQAEDVLNQIREIDSQLSHAVEAYNLANLKLERIEADVVANTRHLGIARRSLKGAQSALSQRLVALYVNGGRSERARGAARRGVARPAAEPHGCGRPGHRAGRSCAARGQGLQIGVQARKVKLRRARVAQRQEVAERAAQRSTIESQLREREQMLASVREEIAQLEAEEAARQARLQAAAACSHRRDGARAGEPGDSCAADRAGRGRPIPAAAVPDARYGGVVGIAMQYLGIPYAVRRCQPVRLRLLRPDHVRVAQVGVSLPHHAASQYGMGTAVSRDQLQAGDLVFFNGLGHAGIYIGGDQFIHSPHTGDVVKISSLSDSWYAATYVGARRI